MILFYILSYLVSFFLNNHTLKYECGFLISKTLFQSSIIVLIKNTFIFCIL
uniref:Uncharacterized protein n=1 Tax=virus sp. ctmTa7 TaxID=2828255 RepID=A0A8S5RC95_9VIRU|nr:MAG TPA: hypothetical protein [virus sp. ctmTa7]